MELDTIDSNRSPDVKKSKRSTVMSMHNAQDLVALAQSVQNSHQFVKSQAFAKLSVIAEQMEFLQAQALQVLEKAKRDEDLHNIPCNLQKIPGKIYYLYKKVESGDRYFSMISPEEWGDMGKDKCLGEYRLEADRSWTSEDEMSKMQLRQRQCNRMVLGNKAMIDFGE